ncbi:transport and Golgi organization protein 6 [Ostrinia nubilalis]|uniref:transport and Golgi organization protein 6 n=1 Tax=Ostrinia nubilalis TaxID=29057 RepID=UPI0030824FA9
MAKVSQIFSNIEKITLEDGQKQFMSSYVIEDTVNEIDPYNNCYKTQKAFLTKIIKEIDDLSTEVNNDPTILISVKNQKLLRTCYQLITSIGFSQCLIPGVGINLSKRCSTAKVLTSVKFSDEQKYEMLTECTDFFTRSYTIPVLKKIILTLHLSDYLAALIQLSFAPLKKPGSYGDFVMTQELYEKLSKDREKYMQTYEYLVANSFQPILMKELLVLQSVREPSPPMFVKRVVAKEMSRRLLAPGGLLSLIRCFMETYDIDTGFDWKKIDMICKIVSTKHGTDSNVAYLNNICTQLSQILTFNNTHYLTTAIACILSIHEKFPETEPVKELIKEVFHVFVYNDLVSKSNLPGTMLLTPQEVDHKVNILNACLCASKIDCPPSLVLPNFHVLFLLGMNCSKNEELKIKLKDILLKCFELFNKEQIVMLFKDILFGKDKSKLLFKIEEYDAGISIKCISTDIDYPKEDAFQYFLNLLKLSPDNNFVQTIFEISLSALIDLDAKRKRVGNKGAISAEGEPTIFNEIDEQYITVLQLLSELSSSPKILSSVNNNPSTVLNFVEHFIMNNQKHSHEECVTIALVLLNTILSNSKQTGNLKKRFEKLIPLLKSISADDSSMNTVLCKEALSLIMSEKTSQDQATEFQKAISDAFDSLLPVRAHGMIALTKLIDSKDLETISKKHYVFCLFQEYLKDPDSYIYLAAVNGIASLGTYCPEDVLHVLCKEFLEISINDQDVATKTDQNKIAELRMKIGDIIVKVTRRLGELAIVHKTILLNTVLCACRDEDPLIRTSALSNLAEICLVLHYKIGSIIYEVLLCIWSILETDKAIECRRAAVMVISSLIKGLGKEVLIQLKDNLLPIYRTLKDLYNNNDEDSVLRLHAQIAIEELNYIVKDFIFPDLKMEKEIFVLDKPNEIFN